MTTKVDDRVGALSAAITEVLRIRDQMKADGASRAELDACVERVVRDVWPRGRETPWRYLCEHCSDTGLVMRECPGDATCGRPRVHSGHTFGTPCWCQLGRRFQPKAAGDDDFTTSTKSKPKPMQRWGR